MSKMTMRVILKSGAEFAVKCEEFTVKKTCGKMTGYDIKDIIENKPVYVDIDEIAAIVRVMSDEQEVDNG